MSELSRRILQRRLELGLSQEELAQRMGYRSKSSITKLEKGVNDIPQSKVEEFAAALETTPAWLMGLENTAFVPPGFEPLPEMVRVPLVGSIACGSPITAFCFKIDFFLVGRNFRQNTSFLDNCQSSVFLFLAFILASE